jgi:NAD(P)H-hydrate epimerase
LSKAEKNGGDGLVAARQFIKSGADVRVLCREAMESRRRNGEMLKRLREYGGEPEAVCELSEDMVSFCKSADIIIDALFGTGLSRPVAGFDREIIDLINSLRGTVISADVPSGVMTDSER